MRGRTLRSVLVAAALSAAIASSLVCCSGDEIAVQGNGDAALDAADDGRVRSRRDGEIETIDGTAPPRRDSGGDEVDEDAGVDPDECDGFIVINEIMPHGEGAASEEFVELYNPTPCAVPLEGWKLAYRSAAGTGSTVLYTFEAGDEIDADGFLVIGSETIAEADHVFTSATGMADNGQVGLLDDQDLIVDGVAYGAVTAGPFLEKTAAPLPDVGGSVGRTDGEDTDDNSADFESIATPTPGAAN